MNFLYDVKDEAECEHMNINILSVNVTNIYFIILKLNYGTIDTDDTPFHGYYIIMFSLSRYTLQEDFNIDVQVISYGEIVCKGTNFFTITIHSCYYVYSTNESNNTIVYLR